MEDSPWFPAEHDVISHDNRRCGRGRAEGHGCTSGQLLIAQSGSRDVGTKTEKGKFKHNIYFF